MPPRFSEEYMRDKFRHAVDGMASSAADLRSRLMDAFGAVLFEADDFHDGDLGARYQELRKRLSSAPDPGGHDGTLTATIRGMSDQDVREAAQELVEITSALNRR